MSRESETSLCFSFLYSLFLLTLVERSSCHLGWHRRRNWQNFIILERLKETIKNLAIDKLYTVPGAGGPLGYLPLSLSPLSLSYISFFFSPYSSPPEPSRALHPGSVDSQINCSDGYPPHLDLYKQRWIISTQYPVNQHGKDLPFRG